MTRHQISRLVHDGGSLVDICIPTGNFDNDCERECFNYFRARTVPKSSSFFGSEFWSRRVLQISHSEPAVKHAVLALSSLHRQYELENLIKLDQGRQYALLNYSKAVRYTTKLLSHNTHDSLEKALVACVLFICYEEQMGDYRSAQMHLESGLCILSDIRERLAIDQSKGGPAVSDDILETFSRLDLQAMTLADSRVPHTFQLSLRFMFTQQDIPSTFSSLAEAQHLLFEHLKWSILISELFSGGFSAMPQTSQTIADLLVMKSTSETCLKTWASVFAEFRQKQSQGLLNSEVQDALTITQIYHDITVLMIGPGSSRKETTFDAHTARFEKILTLIETLPALMNSTSRTIGKLWHHKNLSFELGIVLPLFYIAYRCREPYLRRRAFTHLDSLNCRDGSWDSSGAAKVAKRIMEIEEEGLGDVKCAKQIKEEKRVKEVMVIVELTQRKLHLTCTLKPTSEGPSEFKYDWISF